MATRKSGDIRRRWELRVLVALPRLLGPGAGARTPGQPRTREHLGAVREADRQLPACDGLPAEGGWSAVIRVPATRGEERLVLELLEREHVLVHPGYFFDFRSEAFIVISLLPGAAVFRDAIARVLRFANC